MARTYKDKKKERPRRWRDHPDLADSLRQAKDRATDWRERPLSADAILAALAAGSVLHEMVRR